MCKYLTCLDELFGNRKFFGEFFYFFMHSFFDFLIVLVLKSQNHKLGYFFAFFFLEAARGDGRRAKTYAGRVHWFPWVFCNHIHVECYANFIKDCLAFFAGNAQRTVYVRKNAMIVCTSPD